MTAPLLLGIDLGTTRTKVALIRGDGELVALATARHQLDVDPMTGRAEQDPEAWWAGIGAAVREATHDGELRPDALCVVGHGPTFTPVDDAGRPTRPAITWLDTRPRGEQAELEQATGLRGWALGVLPAARWLERNEPAASAATRWYLNSWEALALRLCGRAATTVVPGGASLARETLLELGLAAERVAPETSAGTPLGGLTAEAARHLGLPAGTPVVAGLVDAFASFHGARMLGEGDAIDVGGAAGGFGVYATRPVDVAGGFTTAAPLEGLYSVGAAMAATGAALDWFAKDILADTVAISELVAEANLVEPGADGLVFLPYLAGERSPLWDPTARGAFAGLTLAHGRAHMVRAILEAAAFAIRHVAEPMLAAGLRVEVMRVCGGPARDDGWNGIKADVTGFPVEVPRVRETAAVGAAILAATGVGAHADLQAAIRAMATIDRRIEPDPARRAAHDRAYAAYRELHPAIAPVVRRLEPSTERRGATVAA